MTVNVIDCFGHALSCIDDVQLQYEDSNYNIEGFLSTALFNGSVTTGLIVITSEQFNTMSKILYAKHLLDSFH